MIVGSIERGGPPCHQGAWFRNRTRAPGRVTEVVLHETVTRSHAATIDVLRQRGLGAHLIVDEHGGVHQHGDLETDLLWHASEHNGPSVGIEVVNPYEPRFRPPDGPWVRIVRAPWVAGGWYVMPTPEQAEACSAVVDWLTSDATGLTIPRRWPGLAGTSMALSRLKDKALRPGIWAHTYFAHADGAWLVLYAWLRLEAKLAPNDAYAEALERATAATHADLSPFLNKESICTTRRSGGISARAHSSRSRRCSWPH